MDKMVLNVWNETEQRYEGVSAISGKTPKRGVDYWTEEDVAEIKAYIDSQIGVVENGTY